MSGLVLRDYQAECLTAVKDAAARGVDRQLAVLPTGGGKTVIFGTLAAETVAAVEDQRRVLILAHRDELLTQARDKLVGIAPELEMSIGFVKAGRNDVDKRVVIASVQTLARQARLDQLPRDFDLTVVDEGHHATADSYRRVIDHVSGLVLAVTATPERADGKSLEDLGFEIVFARSIEWMVEQGYLCPPRGKKISVEVDLASVKKSHGDFQSEALADALEGAGALSDVLASYTEHGEERKALVFCPTVAMAHHCAEVFRGAGFAAEAVDGTTPADERAAILRRLRSGETRILANVGVLTEGFDEPSIDCIIIAAPTRSTVKYTQIVGRGLRLYPGKSDCIAEGQRVLTDVGLVPIEQVTTSMKVWDGVEFVPHAGAICKGEQDVVTYAGLTATPDHKVWTDDGWRAFGECAELGIAIAVTGDGGSPVREADGHRRRAGDGERKTVAEGPLHGLRQRGPATPGRIAERARRVPIVREPPAGSQVAQPSLRLGSAALHESQGQGVPALRRSGDRVPVRVAAGNGALGAIEPRTAPGQGARSDRQRRALRSGQPAVRDAGPESRQQPEAAGQRRVPRLPAAASRGALRRRDAAGISPQGDELRGDRREVQPPVDQAKGRVWDLLNAGPRHRFTVEGVLASNCLILDVVGASEENSIASLPALFGLRSLLDGEDVVTARQRETREAKEFEAAEEAEREEAVSAREQRRRRNAESIKFFSRERMNWTTVGERWTIPLSKEQTIVLWPQVDGEHFDVLLVNESDERFRFLARGLDFGYATGAAEETIRKHGSRLLADAKAAWREDDVTPGQRRYLRKLGLGAEQPSTKGEAADLITAAKMAGTLERVEAALLERELEAVA